MVFKQQHIECRRFQEVLAEVPVTVQIIKQIMRKLFNGHCIFGH